jgi:hypothetical protein
MGFNATRRYRDKKWVDVGLLIAGVTVIVALLAWAMVG